MSEYFGMEGQLYPARGTEVNENCKRLQLMFRAHFWARAVDIPAQDPPRDREIKTVPRHASVPAVQVTLATGIYQWYTALVADAKAKIFNNGRSQAVRLPIGFRFDAKEVYIRRDVATGDVILSTKPTGWDDLFRLIGNIPQEERDRLSIDRDFRLPEREDIFED